MALECLLIWPCEPYTNFGGSGLCAACSSHCCHRAQRVKAWPCLAVVWISCDLNPCFSSSSVWPASTNTLLWSYWFCLPACLILFSRHTPLFGLKPCSLSILLLAIRTVVTNADIVESWQTPRDHCNLSHFSYFMILVKHCVWKACFLPPTSGLGVPWWWRIVLFTHTYSSSIMNQWWCTCESLAMATAKNSDS